MKAAHRQRKEKTEHKDLQRFAEQKSSAATLTGLINGK
jgi:hypothetical protein